jgi:hypothetical protein
MWEGKGGGGRAAFGPVRKRWPEEHGGARCGGAGQGRWRSGVQRKERHRVSAGVGRELGWPALGNSKEDRDGLPRPPGQIEEMNRNAA